MKLWDVVAVCVVLLNTVSTFPLPAGKTPPEKARSVPGGTEEEHSSSKLLTPFAGPMDSAIFVNGSGIRCTKAFNTSPPDKQEGSPLTMSVLVGNSKTEEELPPPPLNSGIPAANMPENYPKHLGDVVDFIQATIKRLKRSPDKPAQFFSRRERNRQNSAKKNNNSSSRKGRRGPKAKNRDCVLQEIHLNVTDLGLGYPTKEELIFRYCSGTCESAVTLYDQILNNLTQNRKLVSDKIRPQPCCRPIAFDDDLSFLDDDLTTYHILRKHSAKKCGCV